MTRAPFVLIGPFETWTTICWPSLSTSRMGVLRETRSDLPLGLVIALVVLLVVLAGVDELLEVALSPDHVLDVQERRAFEADVDERGLHAGQHARDFAEVDVADRAAVPLALDVELGEDAVLDERDAGLTDVDVDDESVLCHSKSIVTMKNSGASVIAGAVVRSWLDLPRGLRVVSRVWQE